MKESDPLNPVDQAHLVVVDHGAEGFWVQGLPSQGEVIVTLSLHLPQHCRGMEMGKSADGRRIKNGVYAVKEINVWIDRYRGSESEGDREHRARKEIQGGCIFQKWSESQRGEKRVGLHRRLGCLMRTARLTLQTGVNDVLQSVAGQLLLGDFKLGRKRADG